MSESQNPFGLSTVTPYLIVSDAQKLISQLQEIIDARLRGEVRMRDDGSVQHAELQVGDAVIMVAEPMPDMELMPAMLYVYVADADEAWQKAIDAGMQSVLAVEDYPHGDRYGGVKDDFGNTWWLVTHTGKRAESK